MKKIKKWLEENKIFFDITAAILIGAASFVVSVAGYRVNQQTLLATQMSSLPYFFIGKRGDYNEEMKKYTTESLVLSNGGAPAINVEWSVKTFIVIQRSAVSKERMFVPLVHYYTWMDQNLAPSGEIATYSEPNNLLKFSTLYRSALSRNEELSKRPRGSESLDYIFLEIARVSTVRYTDRFGQDHTEYFLDYRSVSPEKVTALLKYAKTEKPLDLDDLTLDEIIQKSSSEQNTFVDSGL